MIWFHEHALEYEYSFYGVRLSFALAQWQRLGLLYSPAHVALVKERNDILHEVTSHPMQCESFDELIALNHVLDKSLQSIATLEAIHRQHEGVLSTGLLTGLNHVLNKGVQNIAALEAIDRQHQGVFSTGVLTRCWSKSTEIMAVEFTSNLLIEEYVGNLFDSFVANSVTEYFYNIEMCDELDIPYEECGNYITSQFIEASQFYITAAMNLNRLGEAGQIGAKTLEVLMD